MVHIGGTKEPLDQKKRLSNFFSHNFRLFPQFLAKKKKSWIFFFSKKKSWKKKLFVLWFEHRISRVLGERHDQARPYEHGGDHRGWAFNEDRTRDLALTKRMLCQLSYEGEAGADHGGGHRVGVGGWWRGHATASDPA